MNNLSRYKQGEKVLLSDKEGNTIEATLGERVRGTGKNPSLAKVSSSKALYAFAEKHPNAPPRREAWLSSKVWFVLARVAKIE